MKKLALFLVIFLAMGGSLFAQSEGVPVRLLTGAGAPGGAMAHTVGTQYIDISVSPNVLYVCSSISVAAGPSPPAGTVTCNWTAAGGGTVAVSSITTQSQATCAAPITFTTGATFVTDFFLTLNCNATSNPMAGPFVTGTEVVFSIQNTGTFTFAWPAAFLNTPTVQNNGTTVATFQYCGSVGFGVSCPANSWQNTDVSPAGINPALVSAGSGYTFSVVAGTVSAVNNVTGVVDFTGTDAAAVVNSAMNNISTTCGKMFFKNGVYNINSVTAENTGAFTHFYAFGIPGNAGATQQKCSWYFLGESEPLWAGESTLPVQNKGVIFNITPTAVTAAGVSTNFIAGWWQRPDVTDSISNYVYFENMDTRFPTNQRGCEAAYWLRNANTASGKNVQADFNIAMSSLAAPVAGTNCTLTRPATDPGATNGNLDGWVTSKSASGDNVYMDNVIVSGYNVCFNIDSEHSRPFWSTAFRCNYGYVYGNDTPITHPSVWLHPIEVQCIHRLFLGGSMQPGTRLDITGYDEEVILSGAFNFTSPGLETNVGNTGGIITWFAAISGTGFTDSTAFFNAGQGTNFEIREANKPQPGHVANFNGSSATTQTTKQTLFTYNLPANAFSSFATNNTNSIHVRAWGTTAANGNSKTLEIDFATVACATATTTVSGTAIIVDAYISEANAANTQRCGGFGIAGLISSSTVATPAGTTSGAIAMIVAATTPTATGDFTLTGVTVEYILGTR